ncbi:restriction endonuclease subunit S [Prevotella sp.]|uniref:restriction endonuclease subunit S n=1 Tax=Prevotella sp. TaxID=59823 RepID=UPI0027E30D86|nr:restriction endonuclease subunit S [Prevotella sp.]
MITTINNKHKKLNVPNLRFPEFQGEWEKCKLGELTTKVGSGSTPKGGNAVYTSVGHCFVRSQNVGMGYLILDDIAHIDNDIHQKHKATELNEDDVLLNITGASIGRTAIATKEIEGGNVNQHVCIIRANSKVSPNFLCNYIQTKKIQNYIQSLQTGGSREGLNFEQIRSFPISLPNIAEQNKIALLLDKLNERIATQNKIIDKLQSLIRGIRNDVFGKFRKSVGVNAMVGDVLSYEQPQPYIVEDTEYTAEGIPVLTANKAFVLGYTSETDGIYDKGDCIIFDDFTLDCKYVDFPFKVKSSAIKILTAKDKELLRYTFEFMKYLDLSTDEHKRHYIAETQNQELFLPTAQVVRTIAHAFSALSSRMKTVTKQRDMFELQKQYLLRQMFI